MHNLAVVYIEEGRPGDAEAVLEELVGRHPSVAAWTLLGLSMMAQHRPQDALVPFGRALEIDDRWNLRLRVVDALVAAYRFQEALEGLRQLLPMAPEGEQPALWLRMAQLEEGSGRREDAMSSLTKALSAGATGMVRIEAEHRLKALLPVKSARPSSSAVAQFLGRALPWAR
ncbi:MAG: hypothetical protein EBU81_15485 [Proteobacteria bacterium]|nr:hypothetical protein [Pseudomonadota bacterium]